MCVGREAGSTQSSVAEEYKGSGAQNDEGSLPGSEKKGLLVKSDDHCTATKTHEKVYNTLHTYITMKVMSNF